MSADNTAPRDANDYPRVAARLIRARCGNFFRIDCPYCGCAHTHGAGGPGDDPRQYVGHRREHCYPPKQGAHGYIVTYDSEARR